jgi:hypothetical protein
MPSLHSSEARPLAVVGQVVLGGIVQYTDELGTPHTTTFCILYNLPKDEIPRLDLLPHKTNSRLKELENFYVTVSQF